MEYLQKTVMVALVKAISAALTPELFKEFATKVIDFCEAKILGSASKVDDKLLLPVISAVRAAFNLK